MMPRGPPPPPRECCQARDEGAVEESLFSPESETQRDTLSERLRKILIEGRRQGEWQRDSTEPGRQRKSGTQRQKGTDKDTEDGR